ncbi:MAG: pyruvate synthase subunit beta [Asgard group archaeon]|nr:pyruvate synthase subunit beta [Asgard group archaeon]
MKLKELPHKSHFTEGDRACAGCMGSNIAINVMRILGKKTVVSVPPSCMSVFGGTFPNINWDVPYFHMQFANTASTITGIARALKVQGKEDIVVLGMAGDGATADMGLASLSGAAHRDEDILYICYNNEAYENTGIQASGVSPIGVWSSTTPKGNQYAPKDIPRILIAHEATYVATASTSHIQDFINKVEKAKKLRGFRYIEVLSACTPGWKIDSHLGPELVKEAVESGYWLLIEYEDRKLKMNVKPKFTGLKEFISKQGRFNDISDEQLENLRKQIERKYHIYKNMENNNHL